jgi:hypothetical protein
VADFLGDGGIGAGVVAVAGGEALREAISESGLLGSRITPPSLGEGVSRGIV